MSRFSNSKHLAARLITKNGQSVTLTRILLKNNPSMPWRPPENETITETVTAVFLNYRLKDIDGELTRSTDLQVFIAAENLASPTTGDYITRNGEKLMIVEVKTLSPNGEMILFELKVRK